MQENDKVNARPERNDESRFNWFKEFFRRIQLAWYLMFDRRVPVLTKLIPLAVFVYIIVPSDLIPDIALGLGQLDDLAVFLLGLQLFVDLSPFDVVDEHEQALARGHSIWTAAKQDDDIVDVKFRVEPDQDTVG